MKTLIFTIGLIGGISLTSIIVYFGFKPACATYTSYQKTSEIINQIPFIGDKK